MTKQLVSLAVAAIALVVIYQNAGTVTSNVVNPTYSWDKVEPVKAAVISLTDGVLTGWAFNNLNPNEAVSIRILIDQVEVGTVRSDQALEVLDAAICANCARGFQFQMPYQFQDSLLHRVQLLSLDGVVLAESHFAIGGNSAMNLTGTADAEWVLGSQYNDQLTLMGGDDEAKGMDGDDTIYGNEGIDRLFGNKGNDTIYGGKDHDAIYGGDGNDLLSGDLGDDVVIGDNGDDVLHGGVGYDQLYGNSGNDVLNGGSEEDHLFGGKDNDTLNGDDGNDQLSGDLGDDILRGGNGNDTYVYVNGHGRDIIEDESGANTLQCSNVKGSLSGDTIVFPDGGSVQLRGATLSTTNFSSCLN